VQEGKDPIIDVGEDHQRWVYAYLQRIGVLPHNGVPGVETKG
jgi:hypothetical protein